jgi:hypothetical protein
MKCFKLSVSQKSLKEEIIVIKLIIQYMIHISLTLSSPERIILIIYQIGAIIKLKRYNQKPFFRNFSDNDAC